MIHQLENRRLLSASIVFIPTTGALMVTGSAERDQIEIDVERTVVQPPSVPRPSTAQLTFVDSVRVLVDGEMIYTQQLPAGTLRHVEARGGLGNDDIRVNNSGTDAAVLIFGDAGNDVLESTSRNGARGSSVDGGEESDSIRLVTVNARGGHSAYGGGGDDLILGSNAGDVLYGDYIEIPEVDRPLIFGNDTIEGGAGPDTMLGGGGEDSLLGQEGNDEVFAEDGDDWLSGGPGADLLDGGAGIDTAVADSQDTLRNLETLFIEPEPIPGGNPLLDTLPEFPQGTTTN